MRVQLGPGVKVTRLSVVLAIYILVINILLRRCTDAR